MKKISTAILLFFFATAAYSQSMVLHDPVSARVFNTTRYSNILGTPFLFDKWITGSVLTPRGIYKDIQLKLDAYDNTLYFNRDEKLFEFEDQITGFVLMPNPADSSSYLRFRKGLSATGLKSEQYLQIMSEGKMTLYKLDTKILSEVNQINQGVIQSFTNATRYYVMKNNTLQQIKLGKAEILGVLSDKKQQVEAYVDKNNLSFKRDKDVAIIFNYYNSL